VNDKLLDSEQNALHVWQLTHNTYHK